MRSLHDHPEKRFTPVNTGDSYNFKPAVNDLDGDSLIFAISNQPSWAIFDSSNGALSGMPDAGDIGAYANIIITVTDRTGPVVSLQAFSIDVLETEVVQDPLVIPATSSTILVDEVKNSVSQRSLIIASRIHKIKTDFNGLLAVNTLSLSESVLTVLTPDSLNVIHALFDARVEVDEQVADFSNAQFEVKNKRVYDIGLLNENERNFLLELIRSQQSRLNEIELEVDEKDEDDEKETEGQTSAGQIWFQTDELALQEITSSTHLADSRTITQYDLDTNSSLHETLSGDYDCLC